LERREVVKSLDLVVGKPELLKCRRHILEVLNSLDVVAGEGKNFEVLQALHWHNLDDGVCRKRKFLAVLELIDFIVQLLNGVRQLADERYFRRLLGSDPVLGLPSFDGFAQRDSWHFRL